MGGNTTIKTKDGIDISAERIPLKKIGRGNFVKAFQKFIINMNNDFKKDYGYLIWEDEKEIKSGGIFNGSTSFIMSPDFSDSEIEQYKSSAGDLDVAFPREFAKDVFNFLEKNEGKEFTPGIKYVGNNANSEDKLGNTLICIAKAKFNTENGEIIVQAQLDLELSDYTDGDEQHGYIDTNGNIYDSNKKLISTKDNIEIISYGW